MKKIATACEGRQLTAHFGHCSHFIIFEIEGEAILSSEAIANPGHKPGFLPEFLHQHGVQAILSGGMGQGAVDIFNSHGIETVLGAKGDAEAAVKAYLQGDLPSGATPCDHQH